MSDGLDIQKVFSAIEQKSHEIDRLEVENDRLRAELAAEREKAKNYASIKRAFAASLKSNDALREKADGLSEAVWAMLKYMGDDKETFDDLLAPDEWIELARDVRAALARIDAALKGDGDE